jgi:HK97 family phage prohead protease
MDNIRKVITTAVKSVEGKDRVLDFIGSTEVPDRDGEVIKSSAWQVDRYVKNPVVQWAHNYDQPPIGKTLSIKQTKKGETIFEIEFAPPETYDFADTIFKLCKGGFLNATSVGFIPIEYDQGKKAGDPSRTYSKVELLEISIVPVPANPEALIQARDASVISLKEYGLAVKAFAAPTTEVHDEKTISQNQVKDEMDYLLTLCKTVTLNDESKSVAKVLASELKRLIGDDTPITYKSAIRGMVEPIMKALTDHHDAHEACFKLCKDGLDALSEHECGQVEIGRAHV